MCGQEVVFWCWRSNQNVGYDYAHWVRQYSSININWLVNIPTHQNNYWPDPVYVVLNCKRNAYVRLGYFSALAMHLFSWNYTSNSFAEGLFPPGEDLLAFLFLPQVVKILFACCAFKLEHETFI